MFDDDTEWDTEDIGFLEPGALCKVFLVELETRWLDNGINIFDRLRELCLNEGVKGLERDESVVASFEMVEVVFFS